MSDLTQLRLAAREIFDEALRSVDAGAAVRRSVQLTGSELKICETTIDIRERRVYAIAFGKAAVPMACALDRILGDHLSSGLISGPALPNLDEISKWKPRARWLRHEGGHPLPNQTSLTAAAETFGLLERANHERALIIFLVSGGGSAMLEWPLRDDITLSDLRNANQALVSCGASITEVNAVRRAFSAVKGGRLAARAPECDQITLIISDVPAGQEHNVASGPTLNPFDEGISAIEVIERFNLRAQLPESVLRAVESTRDQVNRSATSSADHFVLLDNGDALVAAAATAERLGFSTEIAGDISDQPITTGCRQLLDRFSALRRHHVKACLISGGEFACPVRGRGMGGRNAETALRLATDETLPHDLAFVALMAGTDGIDGNSPAAGGMVDHTTIERARQTGLNPLESIAQSDSYSFFVALGDAITTGPTGTNVRDIRILLASD